MPSIFPTLLESFSRTYLEALYFGLPILTSDRDFARQLCQNAAIYFDPLNAESVAGAMARVMEDADLRQRLVENGQRILAKTPTWDEIAARFVEVLERTAGGEGSRQWAVGSRQKAEGGKQKAVGSRQWADGRGHKAIASSAYQSFHLVPPEGAPANECGQVSSDIEMGGEVAPVQPPQGLNLDDCLVPSADCRLPTAYCPLPSASCLPPSGHCLLPSDHCLLPSDSVRALFNHKARAWRSKYGPRGKLHSRVEQFTVRLARLCLPPARILDLGCGTGEIAAALDQRGYQVTACDFAEEMIAVARSHSSSVDWMCLEPDWRELPFDDGSFDAIVASSVFEYLDDVPRVAAELSRVLRPGGVLLATVPNPSNVMRKVEARLQSLPWFHRLSPVLRKVPRLDSYAAYLRLSRNRFHAQGWRSVLNAANFAPLDESDFSHEAWQYQSRAPLVLLTVKRVATRQSGGGKSREVCPSAELQAVLSIAKES